MTFLQFNYGVVTSTEVAYFSYIYSMISPEHYQRATGFIRSAMLTGFTFGPTLGAAGLQEERPGVTDPGVTGGQKAESKAGWCSRESLRLAGRQM
ncbi:hypothetical protein SRHO_G00081940 [Serrasalmus rhombeus]